MGTCTGLYHPLCTCQGCEIICHSVTVTFWCLRRPVLHPHFNHPPPLPLPTLHSTSPILHPHCTHPAYMMLSTSEGLGKRNDNHYHIRNGRATREHGNGTLLTELEVEPSLHCCWPLRDQGGYPLGRYGDELQPQPPAVLGDVWQGS